MTAETETEDASGRVNRMSDADYLEACTLYENDTLGLKDLADKYGVSRQALSRRFKGDSIIRGSKKDAPEVQEAKDTFETLRPVWIEETRMQSYQALKQAQVLARKIVIDNVRAGKTMDVVDDQLKAVQRFNKILVDNTEATLRLLRAEEFIGEEDLPMLQIEDLTDEDILNHHKSTGALDENATLEDMLQENLELEEMSRKS